MRSAESIVTCAAGLAAALLAQGCQTSERVVSAGPDKQTVRFSEAEPRESREERLVRATEERPDDAKAWLALGDHHEKLGRYEAAVAAYVRVQQLLVEAEAKNRTRYTGGHFRLGRTYAKARLYNEAIQHLRKVLELQPKSPSQASLNADFRESHYLIAAIYYDNRQLEPARDHFETFIQLGGDRARATPWIMKIDEQLYYRERERPRPNVVPRPENEVPAPPPSSNPASVPPPADPAPVPSEGEDPGEGS